MTELLRAWDVGKFPELPRALLSEKVLPTVFECLVWILQSQLSDGSWGRQGPREETAYAILTLASLVVLPIACFFRPQILTAIYNGRKFLKESGNGKPEHLWIEKVTYGSANVAEAYTVAALNCPINSMSLGRKAQDLCNVNYKVLADFRSLIERRPLFKCANWVVLASWIEGRLCVPQLQEALGKAWRSSDHGEYQDIIAFNWMLAKNRNASTLSSQFLCNMIDASILNDRINAVVEHAIISGDQNLLEQTRRVFKKGFNGLCRNHHIFPEPAIDRAIASGPLRNGQALKMMASNGSTNNATIIDYTTTNGDGEKREFDVASCLCQVKQGCYSNNNYGEKFSDSNSIVHGFVLMFLEFFHSHHGLGKAGEQDKAILKVEVKRFFLAQIARMEGRGLMSQARQSQCEEHNESDCPLSQSEPSNTDITGFRLIFAFANCLQGRNSKDSYFTEPQECVAEEIRQLTVNGFLLEQELHKSSWSTSTSEPVSSKDKMIQRLLRGRERLSVAMVQLAELGVSEEVQRTVQLVVDVAEVAGKPFLIKL